ncbi:TIGR03546 family protein [Thiomicrospira microaerophila]|uniref:TIGR03546 family protein n=1 Tax=Thiomicrospira microaerophila TaxID=406020 RepID=UPI0005CA657B|nr:TIGR03546 family protein [Thiomicrospira microaerophila]
MGTLIKLFKALNANQYPGQIALSLTLGMLLGLTPFFSPHTLLTILLIFILRVNFAALLVAWTLFTGFAYAFDPLFHQFGLWILSHPSLLELWTQWYNDAFWRFFNFNNTLVIGSVLLAYCFAPLFFLFSWVMIRLYRKRFLVWVNKFKIIQMLKASDKIELASRFMK